MLLTYASFLFRALIGCTIHDFEIRRLEADHDRWEIKMSDGVSVAAMDLMSWGRPPVASHHCANVFEIIAGHHITINGFFFNPTTNTAAKKATIFTARNPWSSSSAYTKKEVLEFLSIKCSVPVDVLEGQVKNIVSSHYADKVIIYLKSDLLFPVLDENNFNTECSKEFIFLRDGESVHVLAEVFDEHNSEEGEYDQITVWVK